MLLTANYNTPAQLVVSGAKSAVALACQKAKERKGRGIELKVSGAFHSPMMEEANKELAPLLRKAVWRKPRFPVYCNQHGKAVHDGESARESLLRQMVSPVRWIETVRNQYANGARFWLELGPKDIEKNQCVLARRDSGEKVFVSLDNIEETVKTMLDAVQQGLFDKAKRNLDENTYACATLEEVKEKMASQGGFAKTMWCGELACELKMKEEAGVSSRCIPLEQEHLGDTCACCGKPAKHMVYWGVAY